MWVAGLVCFFFFNHSYFIISVSFHYLSVTLKLCVRKMFLLLAILHFVELASQSSLAFLTMNLCFPEFTLLILLTSHC